MGCCLSSPSPPEPHYDVCKTPPPPVDKETVKEVLSKTPLMPQEPVFHDLKTPQPDPDPIPEDSSDICSSLRSESIIADDDDDVIDVQQKAMIRKSRNQVSPRKLLKSPRDGYGPGRVVGNSPTRRVEYSPDRRYVNGGGPPRRVGLKSDPNTRRDPGDSSGRRSRSPGTRVTDNRGNVSRSPSANRRNPGRVMGERSNSLTRRRGEEPRQEGKWAGHSESLDNPLVSLECFIFL